MAIAPFQLWMDLPAISTAVRSGSTVTVTTSSSHGLSSGAYIQMEGATGAAGTSMNTVAVATVTGTATFTYTAAGSAGTATVGSAVVSQDLFNPLVNYAAGTARDTALYVELASVNMSASGDGQPGQMSFRVMQDDTPGSVPWYLTIPDQARVRLAKQNTGTAPAATDLYFIGIVLKVDAEMSASGQGTLASVSCSDANIVLDKLIIYGKMPKL